MDKNYQPGQVEKKWSDFWITEKFGESKPGKGSKAEPYTIVIPPPNVTGILHMGHALNNTIQDILIRYKRMQGYDALWMPGTDHAGIATQNVVERKLRSENKSKNDLGRDKFITEVWKWKEEHGSTIINQLKRLGASCAWSRERFTMDEGLSGAVREVFVRLYEKKLIEKRKAYLVNWCPRCKTALSDEEAEHRDVDGKVYYIKYPIDNAGDEHIIIATTRPETMLGDVAVCVNPKDKRYKSLKGKRILLPVLNKPIPLIYDEKVKMDFGTGALKITPAHDPVDFEIGQKHKLPLVSVMNPDATMNADCGEHPFIDMDRFECREGIVELLKELKLFVKSEDHRHAVGHCYRCHTVVEPRLSSQWFVKMKKLAKPAIANVKNNKIRFHPVRWKKVYLNWMENIRDWCISRQIWWGHQIPVWYDTSGNIYVARSEAEAGEQAKAKNGKDTILTRDADVLDTWFSSWLWPFSTFGWPEKNKDLEYYYPTNTLATAPEIIFFWVARMIMAGYEFMGDTPFTDIYLHGTVRDATGRKMSKSLGNTIDPLEIIDEFGADALRFSLISITAQGQDVFLSKEKFHIGRNFANKIWNASRFILSNIEGKKIIDVEDILDKRKFSDADKFILHSLNLTIEACSAGIAEYKFNDVAHKIYEFFWHDFCDQYIEIIKKDLDDPATLSVAVYVLRKSLELLHPVMPFITEDIWQRLPDKSGKTIMHASWPVPLKLPKERNFLADSAHIHTIFTQYLFTLVAAIRHVSHQYRMPKGRELTIDISCKEEIVADDYFGTIKPYVEQLIPAKLTIHTGSFAQPKMTAVIADAKYDAYIHLAGLIDFDKERARIQKEIDKLCSYNESIKRKLDNSSFVQKAPPELVANEKKKLSDSEVELQSLKKNLENLVAQN